jgi:hypothetical protein
MRAGRHQIGHRAARVATGDEAIAAKMQAEDMAREVVRIAERSR